MNGKTKLLYVLLAFVISVMLWIYVVGVESPQKEDTITGVPVTFVGVDEIYEDYDLVITSEKRVTVDLTVFGSMRDIAALNNDKESISVVADLSHVNSAGTRQLTYTVTLPNENVTLLERSPYYLSVTLEKVMTSAVEIYLRNDGSVTEGYIAKTPLMDPVSLLVTGPQELVERVHHAEVVWSRENMDTTLTMDLPYEFCDEEGNVVSGEGLEVNYEFVNVTVPVLKMKTIPLSVEFIDGAGATGANATADIYPPVIEIAGDASVIDGLNNLVVGTVDLKDVVGSTDISFPINLPNGVESLSGETECTAHVRIEGLAVKNIDCEQITAIYPPEGLVPSIITVRRTVTLRGSEADIALIEPTNIRIVADLSEAGIAERGRYTVPAVVYVDGFPNVGVIGTHSIALELIPEDELPPGR